VIIPTVKKIAISLQCAIGVHDLSAVQIDSMVSTTGLYKLNFVQKLILSSVVGIISSWLEVKAEHEDEQNADNVNG